MATRKYLLSKVMDPEGKILPAILLGIVILSIHLMVKKLHLYQIGMERQIYGL
jgi:hypothetical protein